MIKKMLYSLMLSATLVIGYSVPVFATESVSYPHYASETVYVQDLTTDEDLTKYASSFLEETYGIELKVPISFKDIFHEQKGYVMYGKFVYYADRIEPIEIAIQPNELSLSHIEQTVVHELTHYYLYMSNKEHREEDEDFIKECEKNKLSPSIFVSHVQKVRDGDFLKYPGEESKYWRSDNI